MENKMKFSKILPVICSFFIMGIVDLIGTAINYVKVDFSLNDSTANVLSLSCFFCFLVWSVPTGLLMNRIGRKNTVLISFAFTLAGVLLPLCADGFALYMLAFTFIGVGNTMIQVALNPLLCDVVSKDRLTVSLTVGQLFKVISSWLGPNIAAWFALYALGWKYVFGVYAVATLAVALWLWITHIDEEKKWGRAEDSMTFVQVFSLLKDRKILCFFIGILILVGVDVGFSTTFPKFLVERCPEISDISSADQLKSYFYFIMRAAGAFVGSILMIRCSEHRFYLISSLLALAGLLMMLFCTSLTGLLVCTTLFALGYSNLFAMIFSFALKYLPAKANEISALLIVGVSGGCFAFLLGIISDITHSQWGAMAVLAVLWVYTVWLIKPVRKVEQNPLN